MDKVDVDNFMDKVHGDSFANSNREVDTNGEDGRLHLTAHRFVDSIKLEFEDDSRYKKFISIMKAYKKSRYIFTP